MSGELLLSENGAGVPPRVVIGAGVIEPDEPTDADLFWSLYRQPLETLSGLEAVLDKHNLPPRYLVGNIRIAGLERFITAAKKLGLIQTPKPLSLRQYIGALFPH
ncbi:MAG: hypothetical protein NUV73_04205 [Candidatus Daviesbacteria bacterium]|nr:hypothetical protein [Candidatus Daviesbacteria bacterium]